MSEYRCVITVNADADEVFGYVSDPATIPEYLPTVSSAKRQGSNRVSIEGTSPGGPYKADGSIRIDEDSRRMEWRSDGENRYHGWLQVAGDGRSCQVSVRLLFDPNPALKKQMEQHTDNREAAVDDALRSALKAIKSICEGTAVPTGGVAYADNPPG